MLLQEHDLILQTYVKIEATQTFATDFHTFKFFGTEFLILYTFLNTNLRWVIGVDVSYAPSVHG